MAGQKKQERKGQEFPRGKKAVLRARSPEAGNNMWLMLGVGEEDFATSCERLACDARTDLLADDLEVG